MVKSRHTLKEFMKTYDADKIQLVFGQHLINIDTSVEGSAALVRALNTDAMYSFIEYIPEFKYLRLTR